MNKRTTILPALSLIVFISSLFITQAQNQPKAWYVYKNATGLNNGTNWDNAWTSLSNINWNSIQAGDTIYISGGSDSLIYNETFVVQDSNITIKRSYDIGHSGKIIIDVQGINNYCIDNESYLARKSNIIIDGLDNSKLELRGFKLAGFSSKSADNITLKNFTVRLNNNEAAFGIFIYGRYNETYSLGNDYFIENIRILQDSGSYNGQGNSDGIHLGRCQNVIVRNCYVQLQNSNPIPHSDCIQIDKCKDVLIENSKFKNLLAGLTNDSKQAIFLENVSGVIKIRNSYVYYGQDTWGAIISPSWSDVNWMTNVPLDSFIIVNNTIHAPLRGNLNFTSPFSADKRGRGIFMNNICVVGANVTFNIDTLLLGYVNRSLCNNNIYYKLNGSSVVFNGITFSTWQSRGYDSDSFNTNPSLVDYIPTITTNVFDQGANLRWLGYGNDIEGTLRPQGSSWDIGAYEFVQGDSIAPEVVSAQIVDSVTVRVVFTEPIEQSSASNPNNYLIDNGININSVQFDGVVATLNTSVHSPGFYRINVWNVTDTAGNIISAQNNSALYGYNPDPLPGILKFTPTRSTASSIPEPEHIPEKTFDGLGYNGGDPSSRWAAQGLPQWIVYDLGDAKMVNKTRIQFFRWLEGRIYTYSILVSIDSVNWVAAKQNVQSGPVEWNEEIFEPVPGRYVKILIAGNNENDWANIWETEIYGNLLVSGNDDDYNVILSEFKLEQNYPNPFNPTTKIRFVIPNVETTRRVVFTTLKVYDILGNEVATLVNENKASGVYEVEFDANNLPSGVYLYRLQVSKFVEIKKMILIR